MNRIIFFSKYTAVGASSRYRVYQYLPYFQEAGFLPVVKPLFGDEYLLNKYNKKKTDKLYVLKCYLLRTWSVLCTSNKDHIYIEYELLPYFPPLLEKWLSFTKRRYIVDYDDAIFHNYDSNSSTLIRRMFSRKISSVIRHANHVITGSSYLLDYAKKFNRKITLIPTSIDFHRYNSRPYVSNLSFFTIGWIGLGSNSINVINILPAIRQFAVGKLVRLVLIGFDSAFAGDLAGLEAEIRTWKEDQEIEDIKLFDVGIMPLIDTPFNRGKCGFKLVQYMACGIPTISTPLPANIDINQRNENLFASSIEEWVLSLETLYSNRSYFSTTVGLHNKEIVKENYSVQANHKKFIKIFETSVF